LCEAKDKLDFLKLSPEEQARYDRKMNRRSSFNSVMDTARMEGEFAGEARGRAEGELAGEARGRAEGELAGEARGIAKGKAEGELAGEARGIAKGKAEGIAKGKAEGMQELLSLLESGVSLADAKKKLGLA
jgi:predicted transposase YdaD